MVLVAIPRAFPASAEPGFYVIDRQTVYWGYRRALDRMQVGGKQELFGKALDYRSSILEHTLLSVVDFSSSRVLIDSIVARGTSAFWL